MFYLGEQKFEDLNFKNGRLFVELFLLLALFVVLVFDHRSGVVDLVIYLVKVIIVAEDLRCVVHVFKVLVLLKKNRFFIFYVV